MYPNKDFPSFFEEVEQDLLRHKRKASGLEKHVNRVFSLVFVLMGMGLVTSLVLIVIFLHFVAKYW